MTRILIAALCVVLFSVSAEARQRHKASGMNAECNVTMPCVAPYASTPEQARVARGRYVTRQMGFGSPVLKRPVRVSKARIAMVDYSLVIRAPRAPLPIPATRETRQAETYGAPSPSMEGMIGRPLRYIAGRLICAVNVNVALAERGIKGTGSALAMSFRTWGRSAGGPVPGAVIVSGRRGGGHVAIVSRVQNGVVYAWNATGRHRGWREIPYRKHVIDYRLPS